MTNGLWLRFFTGREEASKKLVNLLMRLCSLGAKFLLTLYMGRFFSLAEMGAYGLVFSAVVILTTIIGQDIGYIYKREIIGLDKITVISKLRDVFVWYVINFALLGAVIGGAISFDVMDVPPAYILYAFGLAVAESIGICLYECLNGLDQQISANITLFIRAGFWVPFVIVLGFVFPALRTADVVLLGWMCGSFLSWLVPLYCWRNWGLRRGLSCAIDWPEVRRGLRRAFPVWVSALGFVAGGYMDRYFVNHFVSLEYVGVMTFYYSFVNAINPLVESGALTFAAPKLVVAHKNKDYDAFWRQAGHVLRQVAIGVALVALAMGFCVPLLGFLIGKDAFWHETGTLWLLLLGVWITSVSLVPYYVLFAQHRDKPIWVGNFLFLFVSLAGNMFFVPFFGFVGIGWSALFSALFLCVWRVFFVFRGKKDGGQEMLAALSLRVFRKNVG